MGSHHHHHEESSDRHHEHKGKRSHELIAGAAAFAAFHAFENHQKAQGKPVSHALAKELLAAFAAAEVEKLIETKGREKWDEYRSRSKTREEVKQRSRDLYRDRYEQSIDEGSSGYEIQDEEPRRHHRHRGEIEDPRGSSSSLRRHEHRHREEYEYSR
ncbi:hypothetical protein H072_6261 [Dactylellina haptotyla CBS 200.50]|uniref:Uncharacterized protein n=1 Tax=Dactylellina haptotyla (strain CBS 200.50) TaxID=1284197 RepID=S8AFR8_DACHA|nr:hypothetical protein H072_6261 [Dactylellina haptotyla CBS 200.50]